MLDAAPNRRQGSPVPETPPTKPGANTPRLRPETKAELAARLAREGAALRANLGRRKAQARARAAADPAPTPETPSCP